MNSAMPKVLQPLAGQPLLQYVLDCATRLAADDVCVVYGHRGSKVRERFSGNRAIRWVLQDQQLGTGHAVNQAMPGTPNENRAVVLYGDVPLLQSNTLKMFLDHCGAEEIGVLTVDVDNPHGYGRIIRENGAVVGMVEESEATEAQKRITEINTGVLCCPARNLKKWLGELTNNNTKGEYYLTDVLGSATQEGIPVRGFKVDNQVEVMGINDKKQLAEAERALQARRAEELLGAGVTLADPARLDIRGELTCGKDVFIDINVIVEGKVLLGDNVRVGANTVVRNSEIGDGTVIRSNSHIEGAVAGARCIVGPFARLRPGSEIADDVRIGNFVEVKKSTIGEGSKVNHLSYVGDASVGSKVNIGAGTITCNYDGANKHHTIIGDGAFIGSGVELVAPVKIGEGATIGAGSSISKDAEPGQLTVERTRQKTVQGWNRPVKKEINVR